MKPATSRPCRAAVPFALVAVATGGIASAPTAEAGAQGCKAPNVVGVSYSMASRALQASGCRVAVRQLRGHGQYRAPSAPAGQQLVGRQSPAGGARTATVTIWLAPLCVQSAAPGPTDGLPAVSPGPTELIAGLFLRGGPLVSSTHCRRGTPSAGTLVVASSTGHVIARRSVRAGRYAVFPLAPGRYLLSGTFAASTGTGQGTGPVAVTISARRTTRRNVVAEIP
jgi:hypothetical protein